MRRRDFMLAVGGAAAFPLAARAQGERIRRVAVLFPLAADDPEQMTRRDGFQQTLERLGWSDGRNVKIDYRFAVGGPDKFEALAKELVALQPDVIFAQSTGVVIAVSRATRTIPIVFVNVSDPIGAGFVASLARPGGNLTGMLLFEAGIAGKWLAMLKEISPGVKRAALLANPKTTLYDYFLRSAEAAAPSLAVEMVPSRVENAAEIERAIEAVAAVPGGGLIIAPDSTMLRNRDHIIGLAARYRLPAAYAERVYATAGGLMSYGIADLVEPFRQAASYVDRILRG
jgi:putative ABC transport system substrate-binding protein